MTLTGRIAIVGAGNMAEALLTGMLKAGVAAAADVTASDIEPGRRQIIARRFGVSVEEQNEKAVRGAAIVVLAVEPQHLDAVLHEIRPVLADKALVISVAAGYPIARVRGHLKPDTRVVRAMPNTPSGVLAGMTAIALSDGLSASDIEAATAIFESVGRVVTVDESLVDAVTGLSGSGPAYVYVIIEALADGGVKAGLPRSVAEQLAAQTVLGAARMLIETGEHPGRLKDRVASPGGTTIAGLAALEQGRLRATLMNAVEAAVKRSKELAAE
jgi:pyrroline-5-carboxylate reductase